MTSEYKPLIIAGKNSGIPVELNPVQAEFYRNVETQARQGSYWATILIKDLQSLSSGHVKRNVFVADGPADASFKNLEMILPGCRAKVMKCSSGKYLVYDLELDVEYPELDTTYPDLQAVGKKPGLHQVRKLNSQWKPLFKNDGRLSKSPVPVVAVSDGYNAVTQAANSCAGHLADTKMVGSYMLDHQGFDMHYTPSAKIGGLTQINQALNAATDISLYESAALLAHTIELSKDIKNVLWITQGGGSGVFTHALSLLKGKGIDLKDSKHSIYFSHPTTSFIKAQALAMELGIKFDRDNLSVQPFNFNETVGGLNFGGGFIAGYQRMRQDPEYTALNYGVDSLKGIQRNWQPISITAGCAAAVSAALGSGGTAAAIPAVITAATAMAGLGHTLFQSWLPDKYRRLKQKL
ncbi:hypothetical protein KO528_16225 [Saccharophagus degradans]|uniref:hypothetical protein n=1 Tax=Saccharophagus degradans TaxID=86304 RepID=UPI001C09526E|nr:hypothetical protein [Saccharophagus degradans]MBU2986913.1 hypothetical protein [Saccharophagus degradans]